MASEDLGVFVQNAANTVNPGIPANIVQRNQGHFLDCLVLLVGFSESSPLAGAGCISMLAYKNTNTNAYTNINTNTNRNTNTTTNTKQIN